MQEYQWILVATLAIFLIIYHYVKARQKRGGTSNLQLLKII
jgi:hypothetical protein